MLNRFLLTALLALATQGAFARSMLDGDYLLHALTYKGKTIAPLQDSQPLSLHIQGAQISGFAGCNRYFGELHTVPEFKAGPLATTRMACLNKKAQQSETAFLAVFDGAKRFALQNDQLVFSGKKGHKLVFVRQWDEVEQVLYIAPETKSCVAGAAQMDCMQTRESPSAPWTLFYGGIEGFNYVAGNSYKIRVRLERVVNPPADASAIKYVLLEVLGD